MTTPPDNDTEIDPNTLLELVWNDGASLAGGSYLDNPTINFDEAKAALQTLLAKRENMARIDALKQTICHNHGSWSNCHTLRKRISNLSEDKSE